MSWVIYLTELNHLAVILDQHETSRRQWVADTSHELKTPLAVLQAQIEAMQDGIPQSHARAFGCDDASGQ